MLFPDRQLLTLVRLGMWLMVNPLWSEVFQELIQLDSIKRRSEISLLNWDMLMLNCINVPNVHSRDVSSHLEVIKKMLPNANIQTAMASFN